MNIYSLFLGSETASSVASKFNRSKFQVSICISFCRVKVIAFFIFVPEFVILPGKNIRTSDAKRCGSPKNKQKKCRNRHNLFLRAETACPDAFKFETFIPLVRLVFELELFKPTFGISVFGSKTCVM